MVWQKAMAFTKAVYFATTGFPKDEQYGLSSQLKRSAVSVAANIAEGHARSTTGDYIRFLNIAYSSLAEAETHLLLAHEHDMLPKDALEPLLLLSSEIGRMLNGLRKSLKPESRTLNPESSLEDVA
jgi:four helix bundle protein